MWPFRTEVPGFWWLLLLDVMLETTLSGPPEPFEVVWHQDFQNQQLRWGIVAFYFPMCFSGASSGFALINLTQAHRA